MTHSLRSLLALSLLHTLSSAEPTPQFYPLFHNPGHQFPQRRVSPGAPQWPAQQNFSSTPHFLDPLSAPAAAEVLKNDVPRQVYGPPPPFYPQPQGYQNPGYSQTPGYPQIYRVDNLIIIANPPQAQPQPCVQRPLYPRPSPDGDDGLDDRLGGNGPSKCTWAIVACCSPGSNNIRYNCFELLGCPGFFFDNSPCDPKIVMAAAKAALDYYRGANNGTSTGNSPGTDTNSV